MCGDYGKTDSNNDGTEGGFLDFLADIQDGGGAGRSGARFSSGDTSVLDSNNDNYVSEAEYMRGQLASEANEDRGRGGTFGDAYNNSRGVISNFSNSFGALPRGSIASEAALGSDGRDISTSRIARFMQGGGVLGAMGRGLTGGNIMSPEYVAPEMGDMTRDEYDRAIVKSFNSIGNTGEEPVPPEVAAAMGRVRGLNPRAVSVPANVPVNNVEVSTATNTADASGTPYVVGAEDIGGGMVKVFYGNNSSETMPAINYQLMMQNYV
jgi:hypothetical protein